MSEINYQALREKAEKATCGVWSLEYGEGRFDGDDALIHREAAGYIPICRIEGAHPESGFDEDFQMEQQANAEFIAAASPAAVLALLDEREAAKKRIAELEARTVNLPKRSVGEVMHLSGFSRDYAEGWCAGNDNAMHEIRAAGIKVKESLCHSKQFWTCAAALACSGSTNRIPAPCSPISVPKNTHCATVAVWLSVLI
ncbi:ead/Ea22-like family protein [Salmonella enterica subsp. enterica serovar Typhimurium]|nr:ead/Ea22-like family protein [Salmonella enterica]MCR8602843.1 ead/Ea22-like family protein [Salmonella enterica subsp. enterica serovar Typhimurium]